jgi:hypothetical protein
MAHVHDEDDSTYFTEQLCTIGICGALGGIAVMLYAQSLTGPNSMLSSMLVPALQPTVLLAGIALLLLTAVRAVAVWVAAGKMKTHTHEPGHDHDHCCDHDHGHDHSHGHAHGHDHSHTHEHGAHCHHDHDHDHGHAHEQATAAGSPGALPSPLPLATVDDGHSHEAGAGHTHEHGHDHGWGPWRYAVLLLPVMLYFLGLPGEGFRVQAEAAPANFNPKAKGGGIDLGTVDFRDLERAAYSLDGRQTYDGNIVHLKGQFAPSSYGDHVFSLVRYKMRCCAADAVQLKASIWVDPKVKNGVPVAELANQWVEVKGQIFFQAEKMGDREDWQTIVQVSPTDKEPLSELVKKIPPEPAFLYANQ